MRRMGSRRLITDQSAIAMRSGARDGSGGEQMRQELWVGYYCGASVITVVSIVASLAGMNVLMADGIVLLLTPVGIAIADRNK